ncbi:MAG TPA: hypothetical protein VM686_15570 [Polyangiaceae bacterium]|jgi:hypothetical protein|nr:hypothetical protein [Polyangiaceae bacterium]
MQAWVENGDVFLADDHRVVWNGRVDGKPAVECWLVPGTTDVIVLLEHEAGPRNAFGDVVTWPNLVRVARPGSIVWRAEPRQEPGQDRWIAVDFDGEALVASTWSCWRCTLDVETGRVLRSEFTK